MEKAFKRLLGLILMAVILFTFTGCGAQSGEVSTQIPFLVITKNEGKYVANLYQWDLGSHEVTPTGEVLYRVEKGTVDLDKCRPVSWDGAKNLILFPEAEPTEAYATTTKKIIPDIESSTIVGQGVSLTRTAQAEERTYQLKMQVGEDTLTKELTIPDYSIKTTEGEEIDVSQWGGVTAAAVIGGDLFMLYPSFAILNSEEMDFLFVVKYDPAKDELTWNQVKTDEELGIGPSLPPLANTVATSDSSFVLTTFLGPAILDLDSMSYTFLKDVPSAVKKIDPEVLKSEFGFVPISVLGAYKELIFTDYPKESATGSAEHYYVASNKDQVAGILHITPNAIQVLDEEGKVLFEQKIELDEELGIRRSIVFPNVNGNFSGKLD